MTAGDLDIRHGGALAVDTDVLRETAVRIASLSAWFAQAAAAMARARGAVVETPGFGAVIDVPALASGGAQVTELEGECERAVAGVRLMADAYELVELRAQAAALSVGGAGADRSAHGIR